MKRRPARAAALLCLAASACWVPVERGQQMEERIQRLEEENVLNLRQLEEQRAVVRERVATVDKKIAEVQKKLDELNAAAHRTGADLSVNQDRLIEEMRGLRGKLEEAQHRLDLIDKETASLKGDTEGRFAALKGAGALEEFESKKKAAELKRPADKAAFLALAQKQEQAGERGVARELYEEYVKKWPSDPRSADAWFRLGEIAYGDKRYREAVLAFGKVVQDFPRSDKAPDALLRTGESMVALDLKDDAKAMFQDVMARFPKSTAAQKAKARLAQLGAAPAKKKAPPAKKEASPTGR
ncbi:MAG TPA: tol-pal system protein YbgF [Anaeromyxobacteraceae bacterium]|nr:tol-pal system protein YbgF [Anaeromyxobacteraceae bacterium]